MIALIILTYFYRRDSKRATLVSFINLLSTIEKQRRDAFINQFRLVNSELFDIADDKFKRSMIDDLRREYELRKSVLTVFLDKLKEADAEWRLNRRLHQAVDKVYNPKADDEFESFIKERLSKHD